MRYWNDNTASEWNDMRHYWEGGGGRIATIRKETITSTTVHEQQQRDDDNNNNNNHRRLHIDWTNLLDENQWNLTESQLHHSSATTNKTNPQSSSIKTTIYDATGDCVHGVVVVRSREYVEPFQMTLLECSSHKSIYPSTATTLTSIPTMNCTNNFTCTKVPLRKRNHRLRTNTSTTTTTRRRSRNINVHLVTAPRLSVSQRMAAHRSVGTIWNRTMESSSEKWSNLSQSILICTIQIIGPGTWSAGCSIYYSSQSADHRAIRSTDVDDGSSSSNHSDTDPYSLRQDDDDKDDFVLLGYVTTGTFLYLVVTVTVLPSLVQHYGYKQFPIHCYVWGTTPPPPPPPLPLYHRRRRHHHPTQSYWLQLLLQLQPPKLYNSKCMFRIRIVRHGSTQRHCRSIIHDHYWK
jgi:hypothetical protein